MADSAFQYICLRKQEAGKRPIHYYLTTSLQVDEKHLRTFIVPKEQDLQDYWRAFDEAMAKELLSMKIPIQHEGVQGSLMVYMGKDEATVLEVFDAKAKSLTLPTAAPVKKQCLKLSLDQKPLKRAYLREYSVADQ
jgi:hypothetical protein